MVDSGSFTFGTDFRTSNGTQFLKKVHISGFFICKYELTQAEWVAIMGNYPGKFRNCPDCPADSISWYMTEEFIGRLNQLSHKNYRLPTEAGWEYAKKGGRKGAISGDGGTYYKYSGSDNLGEAALVFRKNSSKTIHPVGLKKPNQLGLYDMTGNAVEWCNDWSDNSYYGLMQGNDPQGPRSGRGKVVRGSAYYTE